ncbi:MAG: DUF480 domain-containing protein [Pirellulales bacterium]
MSEEQSSAASAEPTWQAINSRQRRILGVLMEKAKTTPDAYPLSLASLVSGANQKSNRYPLMNLTPEQVEDELAVLRRLGAAAEVQGSGRVARYRHYGHNWLGVKGVEAAVMIELLLRGQQTMGDLRVRASRFEPIADLPALQAIIDSLKAKNLVIALTPSGRGQLFTHNLYTFDELQSLKGKVARGEIGAEHDGAFETDVHVPAPAVAAPAAPVAVHRADSISTANVSIASTASASKIEEEALLLRSEVADLKETVSRLSADLEDLRSQFESLRTAILS